MMPARTTLLTPVQSLLSAISSNSSPSQLQSQFTSQPPPQIHEHGLPLFAPFIGRTFSGLDGVSRYFDLLNTYLEFQDASFENEDQWIVDEYSMAVFLRGTSKFLWKETGQTWNETFCYRIAVAEDLGDGDNIKKGTLKVQEYKVWADTGALYLASIGKLEQVSKSSPGAGNGNEMRGKGTVTGSSSATGETRQGINRKKNGCGDVVGSGLDVYGSCGGSR